MGRIKVDVKEDSLLEKWESEELDKLFARWESESAEEKAELSWVKAVVRGEQN